jgi:hypothetical protein
MSSDSTYMIKDEEVEEDEEGRQSTIDNYTGVAIKVSHCHFSACHIFDTGVGVF